MKKQPPLKPKYQKLKETYLFTHRDINIFVRIDYINNKISLREPNGNQGSFKDKQWVFSQRGVEFMQGWLDILEAMQEAVKDAKARYEAELAEQSKFKMEEDIKMFVAINEK